MALTREEFAELPEDQKHDYFIAAAVEQGMDRQSAENVFKIIHELTPPIDAQNVDVCGMDIGVGELRVAREYDTDLDQAGLEGHSAFQIYTPVGLISFTAKRTDVVAALTLEIPYVSPKKAPQES